MTATKTTATKPAAPKATDDEIDAAILTSLADAGGADRPVPWSSIARGVPGTPWQQSQAVVRLWQGWKIYALKIGGRTYLSLSGPIDAMIVAKHGLTPRVLPVL